MTWHSTARCPRGNSVWKDSEAVWYRNSAVRVVLKSGQQMKEPQMSERLCRCDRRSMKHSHNLQNTNKKLTFLLNILCMFLNLLLMIKRNTTSKSTMQHSWRLGVMRAARRKLSFTEFFSREILLFSFSQTCSFIRGSVLNWQFTL